MDTKQFAAVDTEVVIEFKVGDVVDEMEDCLVDRLSLISVCGHVCVCVWLPWRRS